MKTFVGCCSAFSKGGPVVRGCSLLPLRLRRRQLTTCGSSQCTCLITDVVAVFEVTSEIDRKRTVVGM